MQGLFKVWSATTSDSGRRNHRYVLESGILRGWHTVFGFFVSQNKISFSFNQAKTGFCWKWHQNFLEGVWSFNHSYPLSGKDAPESSWWHFTSVFSKVHLFNTIGENFPGLANTVITVIFQSLSSVNVYISEKLIPAIINLWNAMFRKFFMIIHSGWNGNKLRNLLEVDAWVVWAPNVSIKPKKFKIVY